MLKAPRHFGVDLLRRICSDVEAKCKFVAGRRLEVHDYKILGALTRGGDRKLRVAFRVEARVAAHRFLEALFVFCRTICCEVDCVKTRIAALEIERLDKAMKSNAADETFTGKKRPQSVQDADVGEKAIFDNGMCIACLVLKPLPRNALDRVPTRGKQQDRCGNSDRQRQPRNHYPMADPPGGAVRRCSHDSLRHRGGLIPAPSRQSCTLP